MFVTRTKGQGKSQAGAASRNTTLPDTTLTGINPKINKPSNMETSKGTSAVLPADFIEILDESLSELTPQMVQEILSKINQPQKPYPIKRSSGKILKPRKRVKTGQKFRKQIDGSKIIENTNARPYIGIEVNGQHIKGLLQNENAVTCLGKDCLDFVEAANLTTYPFKHTIKTVDGKSHPIIGRAMGNVKWRHTTMPLNFYLVPTLKIKLSVGMNFLNAFNLGQALSSNWAVGKLVRRPFL